MNQKIKVLVVDDSAMVREILSKGLAMDPELEVVGSASDPFYARDKILKLRPDVLTLDVEMPRMDGIEFLRRLIPQCPIPVVMVSALTERGKQITFDALDAGAIDFVTKPSIDIARGLNAMLCDLREKVKIAAKARVRIRDRKLLGKSPAAPIKKAPLAESTLKVIAIGASTGGTDAIRQVLVNLPADIPGLVIVQHMPPGFTKMFADRLDTECTINVKEAQTGDKIIAGRALIAPGDYHLVVKRSGGDYIAHCKQGEKVCGHRPSVEVLFQSLAENVGSNAIGVVLTGMGHDGADGLLEMRKKGARTLAQDEATSVVFGMPKEAYKRGGAEEMVPIQKVASKLVSMFTEEA